ncbi:hypothetical protein M153_3700003200 [Pseudoloma neurophilia]|uniref:Uncharacterized protein n=1 Tax=Pseudoloma neurophilia TaxID=146866 RepID=A0A0R0M3R4_9MICR|nr:hypothetical protein M153_3700003200 [Pseudoloma neurophilia]
MIVIVLVKFERSLKIEHISRLKDDSKYELIYRLSVTMVMIDGNNCLLI